MKWTCSPFEIINVFFNTVIWVMLKNNYRKKNIFLILINLKDENMIDFSLCSDPVGIPSAFIRS